MPNPDAPILVTGADGMLGAALRWHLARKDPARVVVWTDVGQLDITDRRAVRQALQTHRPAVILNCAAYTNVDGCESHRDEAFRVNADAVEHLADAADATGSLLVQISTDFVFDGMSDRPYLEDDPTSPRCVYGQSKLAGELAAQRARDHLVVRTAWLYGPGGHNFPLAISRRAAAGEPLRVVTDQVGCPTYTRDLAEALLELIDLDARGVVHACGSEAVSWFDFAEAIVALRYPGVTVGRTTSDSLDQPARRPAYSVLDCSKLRATIGDGLPGMSDALPRYVAELDASPVEGDSV